MAESTKGKHKRRKGEFGKDSPVKRSFGSLDPDVARNNTISWQFASCDIDPSVKWSFSDERLKSGIWSTIMPKLQSFERMTIGEIFVGAKKQNHKIDTAQLSEKAAARLDDLKIEADGVHSLRISGTRRIYGVLSGSVFSIIWYDDDHGDNDTCVCRSHKKHT